jgi:DNA processing protein
MMSQAHAPSADLLEAVSPLRELGAYEALWEQPDTSFKTLAGLFRKEPRRLPSSFVPASIAERCAAYVRQRFEEAGIEGFGVRVHGSAEYPEKLRDAQYPVEVLYYRGLWDLVYSRSVAVVGTRKPSPEGRARARKLVRSLVQDDITIVSGLAEGIDTEAHRTALAEGGRTIAVIGTPLSQVYPRVNEALQAEIARRFLVISQVPLKRWENQDYRLNRFFFPERNATMSALTEATVIVEASETSGTLIQAKAALHQGRKLFILESNFHNPALRWPQKFEELGALRVRDYEEIRSHLSAPSHQD